MSHLEIINKEKNLNVLELKVRKEAFLEVIDDKLHGKIY